MNGSPPDGAPPPPPVEGAPALPPREGERIAKLLARAGIASRREVERMIAEGRVKIGDEVLTTPATVLRNLRGVTVDGKPVKAAEAARLFLFHKPSGLLTAERDSSDKPTIYTALRNALPEGTPRVMPVGRLDFNTEGLLLLTNDGELKRAMELPSSKIPRTYRARTFGAVTQEQLEALSEGVTIEGMQYGSINANMERSTGRNQWIEMTITEGKNREVRRVLDHLGLEVSRLIRTSYGPFELADLPRGAAVELRQVDVERFAKSLSGGPAAQAGPSNEAATSHRVLRRGRPSGETGPKRPGPTAPPPRSGSRRSGPRDAAPDNSAPRRSGFNKSGPDKAGFDKTGPDRTGPYNAGSSRSGPSKTGSYNAGSSRSGPDKAGSYNSEPRRSEPNKSGSYNAEPRRSGPNKAGSYNAEPRRSGPNKAGSYNAGSSRSGPSKTGPYNAGPSSSGPSRSGPRKPGPRPK